MDNGWKSAKPRKKTKDEKRNDKKMRNSYFTQQYESFGENFSNFLNTQDIRRDSYRIFKALADGAIDLTTHAKCFEDPIFIGTLRDISREKMEYHYAAQTGLETYINMCQLQGRYVEGYMYDNCIKNQRSAECYSLLYQAFLNIELTHDYASVLGTLMPILNKYKFSL